MLVEEELPPLIPAANHPVMGFLPCRSRITQLKEIGDPTLPPIPTLHAFVGRGRLTEVICQVECLAFALNRVPSVWGGLADPLLPFRAPVYDPPKRGTSTPVDRNVFHGLSLSFKVF